MEALSNYELKKKYLEEELSNFQKKQNYLKGIEYEIYAELESIDNSHSQYEQKMKDLRAIRSEMKKFNYDFRCQEVERDLYDLEVRRREFAIDDLLQFFSLINFSQKI